MKKLKLIAIIVAYILTIGCIIQLGYLFYQDYLLGKEIDNYFEEFNKSFGVPGVDTGEIYYGESNPG